MSFSDYLLSDASLHSTRRTNSATSLSSASSVESLSLTVLASSRVLLDGHLTPATIVISQTTGKITSVHPRILPSTAFPPEAIYHDYTPLVLLPGLVDAHVHLNEPGRTEWEGFYTGTQAAAFGGVTTVIDMPLNAVPPTTTVANLNEKIAAAQGKCWVDVGFYGGIIPGNANDLVPLVKAGVRGFKGFLIDSGVPEFPAVSSLDIARAFRNLNGQKTTIMFHAEMTPPLSLSVGDEVQTSEPPLVPAGPLTSYSTFLASRPASLETYAIEQILSLAHLAPETPLHIVHLSALEAIPILRKARAEGIRITAETCFHYLSLAAETIADGDTRHKCCPPIRSQTNQDALWRELLNPTDSVLKTIVSDHSPCTPELKLLPPSIPGSSPTLPAHLQACGAAAAAPAAATAESKRGNFFTSWGGISSVGLGLPILYTTMTTRFPSLPLHQILGHISQWCSSATAAQVGLQGSKGSLKAGFDGDVVVFDPEATWTVERSAMLFRNKVSPYQGWVLRGLVRETWVRGGRVFRREVGRVGNGDGDGDAGMGKWSFGDGGKPAGRLLLEERVV